MSTLKGVRIRGRKTFASLAPLLFHYDYRVGVTTSMSGSTKLVDIWLDQTSNSLNVKQPAINRKEALLSDRIAWVNGSSYAMFGNPPGSKVNALHNGNPHMIMGVFRYDNPSNVSNNMILFSSGQANTFPGMTFQVLGATNNIGHTFFGASGTSLGNHQAGTNTVPESASVDVFFMYTFYGSGAGTNNSRITVNNTNYFATRSLAHTASNAGRVFVNCGTSGNYMDAGIRMMLAYDLSGRNTTQINQVVSDATTLLKSISEYSSVITI